MTAEVLDWGTAGNAMRDYVVAALAVPDANVIWADQTGAPQPSYPYAKLKIFGIRNLGNIEHRHDEQIMLDTITVVNASAQTYTVIMDGVSYPYAAGGGDSLTDIRDALQALVDAGESDVTVAASGAAAFTVAGSSARMAFHITTTPVADITRVSTTDGISARLYWASEATLSVDVRSDQTVPRLGSRTLAERLPFGAAQQSNRKLFKDADIAFYRVAGMTDLTGLVSADMESRTVADLIFGLGPQVAEDLNWINTLTTTPTWT
ncbi:MAG: hypothetical protein GY926_19660 [bacterium]|nr:hypothetical protein [bacterium]